MTTKPLFRGKFYSFMETLEAFIVEMQPDWEMVVDYTFSQIGQPSWNEWSLIERTFDQTVEEMSQVTP